MQNKIALITGAARRIGAEIATLLHANGMNVILHYHQSEKEAKALSEKLNKERPHSAHTLQADLLDIPNLANIVKESAKVWGGLDILINNASQFYKTDMGKTSEKDWDILLDCNLKAPFFLAQAAAPYLAEKSGCIINITDRHAKIPLKDYPVYSISKAGLALLTEALAIELGPRIRVNAVAPGGGIAWPEGENTLTPALKEKIIQATALKKAGDPKYIAEAVLFLVTQADYITGQTLTVDGGRV